MAATLAGWGGISIKEAAFYNANGHTFQQNPCNEN